MNYKSFAILTTLTAGIFLSGCEKSKFLDTAPLNAITAASVFSKPELAKANLLTIYGLMPQYLGRGGGVIFDMNTRDAAHSFSGLLFSNLRDNSYNAGTGSMEYNLGGQWVINYEKIRQANTFLAGVDASSFDDGVKKVFRSEGRFLRALYYLELYRFYRGVPIITTPQSLQDSAAYKVKRNTAAETIQFIVNEFEAAAAELPVQWKGEDKGRAEKGASLAMEVRALLYKASLTNDQAAYQQAAAVAQRVLDLNTYSLHPDYGKMFFDKSDNNREFIVFYNTEPRQINGAPDWVLVNAPESGGAWGGGMPSQNLVDQFEMTDGKLPAVSPLYNPQDPYKNRDPRFDASIYHQGSTFKGIPLQFYVGGKDYIVGGNQSTGYYIKKAIDETITNYYEYGITSQHFLQPILRYADLLLMYAEALNESGKPEDAAIYVNQVRDRPGVKMPPLPGGLDKIAMREKIRHERQIELNFEEMRYHDVRRWNIAKDVCAGPLYGVKITKNGDGSLTYGTQLIETRNFEQKYTLLPIPQEEINKNPNIEQNDGF